LVNNTLSTYATSTSLVENIESPSSLKNREKGNKSEKNCSLVSLRGYQSQGLNSVRCKLIFMAAMFLVSVPVFIEAPLVRSLPLLSLALTFGWVLLSFFLMSRPVTYLWGDVLLGFSWSWLAGSIYWGWLRWEPLWHLPVEAIGLPFALWGLSRNWGKVGNWFYLGSLFGTVLTDVYFYLVDLIPYWRQIMHAELVNVSPILQNALAKVQTPWGEAWAIALAVVLLVVGILPLSQKQNHWYAFSGAVLSTILVDSLFLLAAALA
jgi:hypothetical protein